MCARATIPDRAVVSILACFGVCAADLGCEPSGLRDLLDVDAPREVPARTAMRCIEYTRAEETRNEYADHTDLSFVTVAPRGSCAALRVRDMLSLKEVDVERAMGPDTLLVYCGDLMARLTGNSFPAAMHRPVGAWEGADANYRYALPFFLDVCTTSFAMYNSGKTVPAVAS